MIKLAGLGKAAAASILISGIVFGTAARAQEISEAHIAAARQAIASLGVTDRFDDILPGLAERLKAELIQASPNVQDAITATVDAKALELAPRRADLEREAALTYARAFSVEELNAISTFYSSEAGKKLASEGRPYRHARTDEGCRHLGRGHQPRSEHLQHDRIAEGGRR